MELGIPKSRSEERNAFQAWEVEVGRGNRDREHLLKRDKGGTWNLPFGEQKIGQFGCKVGCIMGGIMSIK